MRLLVIAMLSAGLGLWAQEDLPQRTFRTSTTEVLVPVTVKTSSGMYVSGLEEKDFRLYDNNKIQDINLDVSYTPISLVVAIQRNSRTHKVLPAVKRIGSMLEALVVGEQGEAALLAFDHRIKLIQDWTNDGSKFKEALDTLTPGSRHQSVIDAVWEGIRMLKRRPTNQRRILLLISETRDRGSEGRMRDALVEAEFANIVIYTININRVVTSLTAKAPPPRPSTFPPSTRQMPGAAPQTPHMAAQLRGEQSATFVPVITEIFTQVRGLFVPNHAEVFTQYTGGREYSFVNLKTLERAISDLGEELHSQYLISYSPSDSVLEDAGYHKVHVEVNRPSLTVRTRRGYWMAYKAALEE